MSFTPEQIKILQRASNDFTYFVNHIFKYSVKTFVFGEHVNETARFLSSSDRTIRVSARHHFKSFSFYAYFMWKLMFEGAGTNLEAHYFSYNSELAGYHIGKVKQCIEVNPFFEAIHDRKPTAETVLRYTWDNKHYTTLVPHGLIQFKRGIHGDLIFVDDPFQDPDNELNPTVIYKINEIFKSNILDMPKEPDGELHVAGCLDPDTDILLADGNFKKLKEVTIKDKIIGYDFKKSKFVPQSVVKCVDNGIQETKRLTIGLKNRNIIATFNHPFYTGENWKRTDELEIGDYIAQFKKGDLHWAKITGIENLGKRATLNLTTETKNFVANGFLTHNTPQTNDDFFFDEVLTKRFRVRVQPAISINPNTGEEEALWPEWMDLEELRTKKIERTERIFSREYMCTPVYSTKGFFKKDVIKNNIVNYDLTSWKITIPPGIIPNEVVAGFDIGKKSHPSHLAVFEYKNDKLVMVHQKFMDGWPYSNGKEYIPQVPSQLEYLKQAIKNFKIREIKYDNTRGEFETFDEQGLLPREMTPVVFTNKFKSSGATAFDRLVQKKQIEIFNDRRLIDQICLVTEDYQAIQTSSGHGDSFWSIVLAIMCAKDLIGFYDDEVGEGRKRYRIQTGQKSLFEGAIPKGW